MQLTYSSDELLSEHQYHAPHVVAGRAFHGGFDSRGHYRSPRTRKRTAAARTWSRTLRDRGGVLPPTGSHLYPEKRHPNPAQTRFLLAEGYDKAYWNTLTDISRAEARGGVLREISAPDFREILENDPETWALGHLNRGLLHAHGLDEAGDPDGGPGAHDEMWLAIRDLAMGPGKYPDRPAREPQPPVRQRRIPEIPLEYEDFIRFLMFLLITEVQAFEIFGNAEALLRDAELFPDRRDAALEAADLVGRIRQDESVHVLVLRAVLGELRQAVFHTDEGPRPGNELLDPLWARQVRFATQQGPAAVAPVSREIYGKWLRKLPEGERLRTEFEALSDR